MDSRSLNLLFLVGIAPLSVGCLYPLKGDAIDEDEGWGEDDEWSEDEVGDTSTTGGSDDETSGTGTDTGSSSESSSESGSESESDEGMESESGSESESDADGDSGTDSETGGDAGICEAYAQTYGECLYPDYASYVLEWCNEAHAWYQTYSSPACLSAWEAHIACLGGLECEQFGSWEGCEDEYQAQLQACYYDDGIYTGCTLYGQLVAECIGLAAGQVADEECEQTYEELYYAYYGGCGDAFYELMTCISTLDCEALEDPALIEAGCGPQLAAKQELCS